MDELLGKKHEDIGNVEVISAEERAFARKYIGTYEEEHPGALDYILRAESPMDLNRRRKEMFEDARERFVANGFSSKNADAVVLSTLMTLWQANNPAAEKPTE